MINSISTFADPALYSLLTDIASRYKLRRGSGRYAGPCPKCGGSARSDKFVIQDDGGFKCYGCDFKGDIITWLREMEGKSCPRPTSRQVPPAVRQLAPPVALAVSAMAPAAASHHERDSPCNLRPKFQPCR